MRDALNQCRRLSGARNAHVIMRPAGWDRDDRNGSISKIDHAIRATSVWRRPGAADETLIKMNRPICQRGSRQSVLEGRGKEGSGSGGGV